MCVVRQKETPCQSPNFRTYDELCLLADSIIKLIRQAIWLLFTEYCINLVKFPLWKSIFDYVTV